MYFECRACGETYPAFVGKDNTAEWLHTCPGPGLLLRVLHRLGLVKSLVRIRFQSYR